MNFRDNLKSDLENILTGEFSVRIVFFSGTSEFERSGIFDETFEAVQTEQGIEINDQLARFTIYGPSLPVSIAQLDRVDVYEDGETAISYKIKDLQPNSEGNYLVLLKK